MATLTTIPIGADKRPLLPRDYGHLTLEEIQEWTDNYTGQHGERLGTGILLPDLVVIDLDGPEAVHKWNAEVGAQTPYCVITPGRGGGLHLYFRAPLGVGETIRGLRVEAGAGAIEVKAGKTSLTVIPPSPHPDGGYYAWVADHLTDSDQAPMLPIEVVKYLRENSTRAKVARLEGNDGFDAIPEGARNDTLVRLAGSLRGVVGFSPEAIATVLHGINSSPLMEKPLGKREVDAIAARSATWDGATITLLDSDIEDPCLGLVDFATLADAPPPSWLWEPYLPENRLTLIDGPPGVGKGLFVAKVAHSFVTGTDLSGEESGDPRNVLWLTAEDHPQEDLRPRMQVLGWDPTDASHGRLWTPRSGLRPIFPLNGKDMLAKWITELDLDLVILDPGRSFLGPQDGNWGNFSYNNETAVRPGLEQLQDLAQEMGVTILFVHHWNKDRQSGTETRATGSAAFVQVVRHRISFAESEVESIFSVTKSNIVNKRYTVHSFVTAAKEIRPEHDVPYIVFGDRLVEHVSLEAWEKAPKRAVALLPDADDLSKALQTLGRAHGVRLVADRWQKDMPEPFRSLSQAQARALYSECKTHPDFIFRSGAAAGLYWTGRR